MSEHYFQLKNSPVGRESAYAIFNARITYTADSDDWSLTGFVNNLGDEEYRQMVFDLAGEPAMGGFGMAENFYGPPRWWGLSLRYRW